MVSLESTRSLMRLERCKRSIRLKVRSVRLMGTGWWHGTAAMNDRLGNVYILCVTIVYSGDTDGYCERESDPQVGDGNG